METAERASVALLATRGQRLGLALAPQAQWRDLYGLLMLRLELPSAACPSGDDPQALALALGEAVYGRPATPLPTRWTYGPSPRHAVDRAPAADTERAPFLRFERMLPMERATGQPARLVAIEVYRAELMGDSVPDPQISAAILWLPIAALRQLVGGARVAELLALDGVTAERAQGTRLPDDGLVYLPSDYGERHLLRIAAKYGEGALFATPPSGA
jgi:hypothetical protein